MSESTSNIQSYISILSVPSAQYDAMDYCASSPEALGHYLANLPHSNAAELCNRLYKLLPQLAGLKSTPGRKITLLDLAKPEAMECVQKLTNNLAITPSSAKLLSLAIAMMKYLAEGYKSIMVSVLQSPAAPPKLLTDAAYSTIAVLRQILMDCWECSIPPPPNVWRELHAVYQIANIKGVAETTVQKQGLGQPTENNIQSIYVIPLMIACADPDRYTPQDLRHIEFFLYTTAHLVEFDDNQGSGIFIIDPHSDKGPQYSFKVHEHHNRQFRLKTFRLIRHIEESLATGTLSGLSERLAKDLCKYWSQEVRRHTDSEQDNTPLHIVIGLSHIHRFLTRTGSINEYVRKGNHGVDTNLEKWEVVEERGPAHRDTFIEKKHSIEELGRRQPKPLPPAQQHASTSPLRHYPATRTNVSSKGARIEFHAPSETLTAGEIVLIQTVGRDEREIGLVRWTQLTRKLDRRLGIETITTAVTPCAVSLTNGDPEDEQFFPGLIFEGGAATVETRIVLPTLPFKAYSSVKLIKNQSRKTVKLKDCIDATFHLSVFNLELTSQV